jgi:hypothetical protein
MTIDLPQEEFRRELQHLTGHDWEFVSTIETLLGVRRPFTGEVTSQSFTLRRNWRFVWTSYYISGTYFGTDVKTTVVHKLKTNSLMFYIIRMCVVFPFLVMTFTTGARIGFPGILLWLGISVGVYFIINALDAFLGRRLNRIFMDELAMMPHNRKSRFQP